MSTRDCVGSSLDEQKGMLDTLCVGIHKSLSAPLNTELPVSSHKSGVSKMLKARDAILNGIHLSQSGKTSLLCSGISCMRRIVCEVDKEDQIGLLKTTQALLFSLLVMSDTAKHDASNEIGGSDTEASDAQTGSPSSKRQRAHSKNQCVIGAWQDQCVADIILARNATSSWDSAAKSEAAVCKAALCKAKLLTRGDVMKQIHELSDIFFRSSAGAMLRGMLESAKAHHPDHDRKLADSFLTLDTVAMLNEANDMQHDKLTSLADAAESEVGQVVRRSTLTTIGERASLIWICNALR